MSETVNHQKFKCRHVPSLVVDTYKAWMVDEPFYDYRNCDSYGHGIRPSEIAMKKE